MVRSILNGRYANTSFCIFDPQGKKRLSRSGRSPNGLTGARAGSREIDEKGVIREMNRIASRYTQKGKTTSAVLQDFLSFRQALNVASADQRLLVLVDPGKSSDKNLKNRLKSVFADSELVGRFHLNFVDAKKDSQWSKKISGANGKSGIYIIQAGKFGIDGKALKLLPLSAKADEIKKALKTANGKFAKSEKRKTYGQHVMQGRRQRIYFENEIPYGEDRDGDGKIDNAPRRRRK